MKTWKTISAVLAGVAFTAGTIDTLSTAALAGNVPVALATPTIHVPTATLPATPTIGVNFPASDSKRPISGFIPPDTMGAVGPNHIGVMINGRWSVYNKTGTLQGV